jgi:hypothetical protein
MAQNSEAVAVSKPWYKKWWGILIIFFTWPLSLPLLLLYLVWNNAKMAVIVRVVLSVLIIVIFMPFWIAVSSSNSDIATRPSGENAEQSLGINDKELVELTSKAVDAFKIDEYTGDFTKITQALNFFDNAVRIGHQAVSSTDPEVRASGETLLKTISKSQIINYPKLRKAHVQLSNEMLWESDVSVSVSGSLNENIVFVGGIFAANKNILSFHRGIEARLVRLRFDQAHYKWIPSASDWTRFDLEAPKDSDL